MEEAKYRIEVLHKTNDPRNNVLQNKIISLGHEINNIKLSDNYLINIDLNNEDIIKVASLLVQPVIQDYFINDYERNFSFSYAIEIGFLPGVTDNIAHTVRESIEDLLNIELHIDSSVFSSTTYYIDGNISHEKAILISQELYNPLIQRAEILTYDQYIANKGMGKIIPVVSISEKSTADKVSLLVDEHELAKIAKDGIQNDDGTRRGPLALDMLSMNIIKDYFYEHEKRDPTDIEIESIAQTWSEHCKHTIFAAEMDDITDGIYKRYIKEATIRIRREKGVNDFCVSVFVDNSGGIIFDDNYIVSDKVETHNSPSALDPFGGAITGIVGVNRDAMGFGMASRPIANRYGFCFADPRDKKPLFRTKDPDSKLLSPRRIMDGVIHGVNVGGNTSGIPTPQGFVYFDERFKGKPLVFVGTVGFMPNNINGKSSVGKKAMPGDCIVMAGGRVGRDGIHGATFSSEALSSGSPATAVQIGDPITQKKMSDAIIKEARDFGLYNSITDNGAGGLSCSVAEMAREAGGFIVDLEKVPLKYPGLSPWQIWVSESQERMTLSVPENKVNEFLALMKKRGVEATIIGKFNNTDRGIVKIHGETIFDLDMGFLHDGLPKKKLETKYNRVSHPYKDFVCPHDLTQTFSDMLQRLNIASFDFISYQYDHEVQGNSVIKPLQGKGKINGNTSVIKPVMNSNKGVVLSQGLYPSYSDIDTYWMAAASIDTAIRNAVSAGGTLNHLAILDNFCWCDSNNPERLGQLKEAARACYEIAVAYGTPFISGKDSMFNDFRGFDENFNEVLISIPPTLLISSIGVVQNVEKCQSIDFKFEKDLIYLLGTTKDELGGSEYLAYMGEMISNEKYIGDNVPRVYPDTFAKTYSTLENLLNQELIASSISIERGGLAVALAKSSMAGLKGINIDLNAVPVDNRLRDDTILFAESQGRILVSVAPEKQSDFEKMCSDIPYGLLGTVTDDQKLIIKGTCGKTVVASDVLRLLDLHKITFKGY